MGGLGDGQLETAAEMAQALRSGQVSGAELVERALARAEAWQPVTNAFSQLWPDEARSRVDHGPRAAEGLRVPIAVKDLYDVAGHETTGCSLAYEGRVARRDAPVIARVRAAGLTMIGKTNQHELAAGGTNLVSACGPAANPWDPARITGGSSGGSGAAVATGVVPWALGSDTGGSIRIPASLCGTFGLKPTTGRLPIEGMLPLAPSMDCPGPIAGTARDTWALWSIMSGRDARDAVAAPLAVERAGPCRIGLVEGLFRRFVHPEVVGAVEEAARALEGSGAVVEPVDGFGIDDARDTWSRICCREFWLAHPLPPDRLERIAPSVRAWMVRGKRQTDGVRDQAERRRGEIARWFRGRLEGFDALLVPTTAYPAFPADATEVDLGEAGRVSVDRIGPGWLTCPVNLSGLPALSFPAGRSIAGLPIGASLIGPDDAEEDLLRIAARWEAWTGYRPERPSLPG